MKSITQTPDRKMFHNADFISDFKLQSPYAFEQSYLTCEKIQRIDVHIYNNDDEKQQTFSRVCNEPQLFFDDRLSTSTEGKYIII